MKNFSKIVCYNNFFLFYLTLGFLVLPIWLTDYPPMVDLPQHAAQVNAFKQVLFGNPDFVEKFEINWFTPYLSGYMLTFLFTLLMPIAYAFKTVLTLTLISTPVLCGLLLEKLGGNKHWRWLLVPSTVGFLFHWGFFNFLVSIPFGMGLLIFTVSYANSTKSRDAIAIAILSVVLFFSHALILCYFGLMAVSYLIAIHFRDWRTLIAKLLPLTVPIPLLVFWAVTTYSAENQVSDQPVIWQIGFHRLIQLPNHIAGFNSTPLGVALLLLLITVPVLDGAKPSKRIEKWLPFTAGCVIYFLFPRMLFGTDVLHDRFAFFLPVLWLLVWEYQDHSRKQWHWVGMLFVGLAVGIKALKMNLYDQLTTHFSFVLDKMEPGKKALSMVLNNGSEFFGFPLYLHMPAWYQAEKNGIVDLSFSISFPVLIRYKTEHLPAIGFGFEFEPIIFDSHELKASDYDYFVVNVPWDIAKENPGPFHLLFHDYYKQVELTAFSGTWALFENKNRWSGTKAVIEKINLSTVPQ